MIMLLSRTAEDLYWLGRHLERAESLARIVREHTNLLVDIPVEVESDWASLLAVTDSISRFSEENRTADETGVMRFLVADAENAGSLAYTITAARENLRVTRQIVPWSAWECVNRLHIKVLSEARLAATSRTRRLQLCDAVIDSLRHLTGILAGAMTRDHAYSFIDLGRFVERADMTTRVIDVRAGALMADGSVTDLSPADRSPYEDVRWLGVLRSVGGHQMYHRAASSSVEAEAVVSYLVHDEGFPRSVAHSLDQIGRALDTLPPRPGPVAACGALVSAVTASPLPASAAGLHTLMDEFQSGIGRIHDAVCAAYFAAGAPSAATSIASLPASRAG
jgi:uncharacterized alpha-E superfamily protein